MVAVVGVCSMLVSNVIFTIIVEAVSCIFIYYSLDKDLSERALISNQRIAMGTYDTINRYSTNPYLMEGNGGSADEYGRMKN